jgi:hypothetical protein
MTAAVFPCEADDCSFRSGAAFEALPLLVSTKTFGCKKCARRFQRDGNGDWKPIADVVKLELVTVGEGFRFDPDELLEAAKGQGFTRLAILGQNPDGSLWVSGSANAGETVILIELAKHQIIMGQIS